MSPMTFFVALALSPMALAMAVPKESCTTSTASVQGYPSKSYATPSRPVQAYPPETYLPPDSPRPGASTYGRPYPTEPCQPKIVTSTCYKDVSSTIYVTLPISGTGCIVTETSTASCDISTTVITETPPISTVVDATVTPSAVTTTITLDIPPANPPALKVRGESTCVDGATSTIIVTQYDRDYIETITVTPTDYSDVTCSTLQVPATCVTSIIPITTTLEASTILVTTTAIPSTVTATLSPTTTFNVLRATNVAPINTTPEELAIANSNDMYASLRLMPLASDGSHAITFDVSPTTPEQAARFTIDTEGRFFGTGSGVVNYIANTFYTERSNRFFMSPAADPLGSTAGFPPILCSVDANNVLFCQNGQGDALKNQYALCTGSEYTGFNPNGNLFLTIDPEFTGCAAVDIFFEQVILFELIPPSEVIPSEV